MAKDHSLGSINCDDRTSRALEPLRPTLSAAHQGKGFVMERRAWDKVISASGVVIAVVLLVVGALAIYGGNFGRQSVQDRLTPERVCSRRSRG